MKVVVLYHPNSEHERRVIDYARDFKMFKGGDREFELVSLETVAGAHMAKLYDITSYPAVLAVTNDGVMQKAWQDDFPLMNELDFYMQSEARTPI